MTDTDAPARANHLGSPCPPWCIADHDHVLPNGKPLQNHEAPHLWLHAGGYAVSARLQQSGFTAAKPPVLHLYSCAPGASAGLDVRSAEDARALIRLVLAVQQMHDGQIAQLAAALDVISALLPAEAEL